ncbi:MAG: DUF2817 domain-containing protein [Proteobacteria bacterium]|jgi:hypothetical protein|nr:DUF2817 domain-containing protein [Pseudomonadota bacterium]
MSDAIVHYSSWAQSATGQNIELYESLKTGQRPLLFVGGVHGDEPEGVRLATEFISWLQKNNKSLASWALIPCLNIDGHSKNQRTNGNGVDLNRNFPSRDWSPLAKGPRYFPGPHPNSEPEVQALVHWIEDHQPAVIFHFHSWEPCVVYTGHPGRVWAEILTEGNPYSAREDIGYPTPGSLGQFGWTEHQIPVVCLEEQEGCDLELVWPHFQRGLTQIVQVEVYQRLLGLRR